MSFAKLARYVFVFSVASWLVSCTNNPNHISTTSAVNRFETLSQESNMHPDERNRARIRTIDFSGAPATIWFSTNTTYSVFVTRDSGESWKGPDPLPVDIKGAYCVYFFDKLTGWIVDTKADVWKTVDGGETWEKRASFRRDANDENFMSARGIFFRSAEEGWIFEVNGAFYTKDGGRTWVKINPFRTDPEKVFSKGTKIWVAGSDDNGRSAWLNTSSNGGRTWEWLKISDNCLLEDIFFLSESVGWFSCSDGRLLTTHDSGKHWNVKTPENNFVVKSIYWQNSSNGWLAGYKCRVAGCFPKDAEPLLLTTADSGKTWKQVATPNLDPFFSRIFFSGANEGWLITQKNIYRTLDGGRSWVLSFEVPL